MIAKSFQLARVETITTITTTTTKMLMPAIKVRATRAETRAGIRGATRAAIKVEYRIHCRWRRCGC